MILVPFRFTQKCVTFKYFNIDLENVFHWESYCYWFQMDISCICLQCSSHIHAISHVSGHQTYSQKHSDLVMRFENVNNRKFHSTFAGRLSLIKYVLFEFQRDMRYNFNGIPGTRAHPSF